MFLDSMSSKIIRSSSDLFLTGLVLCMFVGMLYLKKVFFNIGFYMIVYPFICKAINRLFLFFLISSFALNVVLGVSCLITTVSPSF